MFATMLKNLVLSAPEYMQQTKLKMTFYGQKYTGGIRIKIYLVLI